MIRVLVGITYLFTTFALVTAGLLGLTYAETYRYQYDLLRAFYEQQSLLLMAFIGFVVIAGGANLWKELLSLKPLLQSVQVYGGQLAQKATRYGIKRELADAPTDHVKATWLYFSAAEKEFAAKRFREAAGSFEKSLDVLPTMSGYLNLGVSLIYSLEFRRAQGAFLAGIQIAQRMEDREFEGAFLNNLGNIYFREGKYERALESYRSALKFYEEVGDSVAKAAVFHNSGVVYHEQGKLEEALKS
jgi:tetratricopeptide (TPR) repeat protein